MSIISHKIVMSVRYTGKCFINYKVYPDIFMVIVGTPKILICNSNLQTLPSLLGRHHTELIGKELENYRIEKLTHVLEISKLSNDSIGLSYGPC